jgi:hypothetical protein
MGFIKTATHQDWGNVSCAQKMLVNNVEWKMIMILKMLAILWNSIISKMTRQDVEGINQSVYGQDSQFKSQF